MHEKAIELRFGQRIGAFLLQRILSRHYQKQIGQRISLSPDGDLTLCHRFEQRRLDLCRCAVDFIGKYQIVKQRSLLKFE